ncbi:MAG TPA: hypothetical protein VFQ23_11175 [Anaerolineales bacterium]|nr:hypothetical protein [Anaerolineales bacterium]
MKKTVHILLLSIFLSGCTALQNINLGQLIASPTAPPPADTETPFVSATPLPTQNLFATSTSTPLTFTPTVTAIGAELFTPTNTETPAPTAGLPLDAFSGNYFTPKNEGFLAVLISNNLMYWNEGPCSPRSVKVSAFVADAVNTDKVLLFTRLREKRNTLNVTEWNSGAIMIKADNGSFNYDVHTFNLRRYFYFREAWLEYQLVALTEDLEVIGRTGIYDRNISLVRCLPVPVP